MAETNYNIHKYIPIYLYADGVFIFDYIMYIRPSYSPATKEKILITLKGNFRQLQIVW